MSHRLIGIGHRFEGQPISWAGACPWMGTLCFGSEDGDLIFVSKGSSIIGNSQDVLKLPLMDPINGVSFVGRSIGVTTRSGVLIGCQTDSRDLSLKISKHSYRGGAHGIVGVSSGYFLAPIGVDGILVINSSAGEGTIPIRFRHRSVSLNCYKLVHLDYDRGGEVFACASRTGGLIAFRFEGGAPTGPLIVHHFRGHDIVDVCPLNDSNHPRAVACVSRSRELFFNRDVLNDEAPIALNYGEMEGTAYSLLSARGHLFLLTDREITILPDLAARFLRGESLESDTAVATMSTEASEAFRHGDDSILLLEDGAIIEYPIAEMVPGQPRVGPATNEVVTKIGHAQYLPLNAGWERTAHTDLLISGAASIGSSPE